MPSLQLDEQLIWFAHCPKAGGTSVEQMMIAAFGRDRVGHLQWNWAKLWHAGGWRTENPPNSPQHLIWDDARAMLSREPDVVFALVRDPVARMVSEHNWQKHKRRSTRLGRALSRLPFSFWLRLMLAMARRNPYSLDNHFRPQTDFVPGHARVFRLEDGMASVVTWLTETTGAEFAQKPPRAQKRHTVPRDPNSGDKARIARAFAADYSRFEYPSPDRSGLARDWLDVAAGLMAPVVVWLDRRGRL